MDEDAPPRPFSCPEVPLDIAYSVVRLLHTLSMMVLLYLVLGWLVERNSTRPDSQVKAFFRVLCSPITRPIARITGGDPFSPRVMRIAVLTVAGVFLVLAVLVRVLAPRVA